MGESMYLRCVSICVKWVSTAAETPLPWPPSPAEASLSSCRRRGWSDSVAAAAAFGRRRVEDCLAWGLYWSMSVLRSMVASDSSPQISFDLRFHSRRVTSLFSLDVSFSDSLFLLCLSFSVFLSLRTSVCLYQFLSPCLAVCMSLCASLWLIN